MPGCNLSLGPFGDSRDADREGLPVPGFDHTWIGYSELEEKFKDLREVFAGSQFFPRAEWRQLFGMAQHYGIPTRLLDWSERALVGAYFAASGASRETASERKYLAVWALDQSRLEAIALADERVVVVRAPWETNPNLRAQRGLFTLHEARLQANETVVDTSLDVTISRLADKAHSVPPAQKPFMYLYRLPTDKAPLLLYLLDQEGINAASIFPGYQGVVDALREIHGSTNYRSDPTEGPGPATGPASDT